VSLSFYRLYLQKRKLHHLEQKAKANIEQNIKIIDKFVQEAENLIS
jgi:hypothetical protein